MPISMTDQLSPLDATEERAWHALAYFFVTAPRILDEDLQCGARMSLSAYTILMHPVRGTRKDPAHHRTGQPRLPVR